ncbi:MAG: hypothetical protein H5T86_02645 [Armatimonadetes bacterium]|nr:hypothetical protein [Armatimonadota bacterium]
MVNKPKAIGMVLVLLGIAWLVAVGAFVLAGHAAGKLDLPATALGLGIFTFFPALALFVGGGLLLRAGATVDRELREIAVERAILDRLAARGQLYIPQLAAEIRCDIEEIKQAVYRIAGQNLLSGYINWQEQKLYSADAAKLSQSRACPNCGGQLELAGKGVIRCPYCGSEIFLPQG